MLWGYVLKQSFVGLCFLDLENETFSQHHFHNKFRTTMDFKLFFENDKDGLIYIYFLNVTHICLIMLTILFQSFISIDTLEHF